MDKKSINLLKDIEKRKALFEEVAQLVTSLNRLNSSLEEIVKSTSSEHPVVERAHELIEGLSEQQKNFSVEKVEFRLENLELRIRDDLSYFLELEAPAKSEEGDSTRQDYSLAEEDSELSETIHKRIAEFHRRVQLSFAYRVLLCEAGESPKPIELDIAPALISQALDRLKIREERYQQELVIKLKDFQASVKFAAKSDAFPEPVRDELLFIDLYVTINIDHLAAGKPISSVPASFELINLDAVNDAAQDPIDCAESGQVEAPVPSDEIHADNYNASKDKLRSGTVFKRARTWLNSTHDVSWKDTKE